MWGPKVVAVHPRAEHAWLLGIAAKKVDDLVLVGARGLDPAVPMCRVIAPEAIRLMLARLVAPLGHCYRRGVEAER